MIDQAGLRRTIDLTVAARRLLDHPFYLRWSRGDLSREELRSYAAQYRHFEAHLPLLLAQAASGTTDARLRSVAMQNLADETEPGHSHLDLFDRFIVSLGGRREETSPAMADLLSTYHEQMATSTATGLAAILAYERQSPEVARSKAAGLREHYGLDDAGLEFWDVHADVDVDHAEWLVDGLAAACEDASPLEAAARTACEAWCRFLDERESGRRVEGRPVHAA